MTADVNAATILCDDTNSALKTTFPLAMMESLDTNVLTSVILCHLQMEDDLSVPQLNLIYDQGSSRVWHSWV